MGVDKPGHKQRLYLASVTGWYRGGLGGATDKLIVDLLSAHYNPTTIPEMHIPNWVGQIVPGLDRNIDQFVNGGIDRIVLNLFFNEYDMHSAEQHSIDRGNYWRPVQESIAWLVAHCKPGGAMIEDYFPPRQTRKSHAPNMVYLLWGEQEARLCNVKRVLPTKTVFSPGKARIIRANVTVWLEQVYLKEYKPEPWGGDDAYWKAQGYVTRYHSGAKPQTVDWYSKDNVPQQPIGEVPIDAAISPYSWEFMSPRDMRRLKKEDLGGRFHTLTPSAGEDIFDIALQERPGRSHYWWDIAGVNNRWRVYEEFEDTVDLIVPDQRSE